MVFLLNIGNTHTQLAEASRGKIDTIVNIPTADVTADLLPNGVPQAAACVVPEVRFRLAQHDVFWLEGGIKSEIDLSQCDGAALGADRFANLIQLGSEYKLPALCVDFGTAITYELLDENKVFIGGAIAPGRRLMRNSLNTYTAQLPLVGIDVPPPKGPGVATGDQMLLGIDKGAVGGVKEIIEMMRNAVDGDLTVVGAGGDFKFFKDEIPEMIFGGEDFTLRGILKAWEKNNKCE
ncbi:type III pantothenate kinase [Lentisphaerota bacterium ZTH]|nr:type III pantothenate kinase [Lentisphaerota bacterium]WET06424.1 type III pantothenate kinase [Lentisphaerota bacterium ZTH]